MSHTKTLWAHKASEGKLLSAQGWRASHEGNDDTCFVPIHKNGKVVALVVATGDYLETERSVAEHAVEIVRACNVHDEMVKAAIATKAALDQLLNALEIDPHETRFVFKANGEENGNITFAQVLSRMGTALANAIGDAVPAQLQTSIPTPTPQAE